MQVLKPGYKTSEFVVTVLTDVGALAAALSGHLSPHWAAVATAVSTAAYALSRGHAKNGPPTVIAPASPPTP